MKLSGNRSLLPSSPLSTSEACEPPVAGNEKMYGKSEKEEASGPGTHRVMAAFRSGRLFAYLRRL
jgi:hypothetical protein